MPLAFHNITILFPDKFRTDTKPGSVIAPGFGGMKWYVYTLSIKGRVFYIGCTKNPVKRYKDHYYDTCSACYKITRYWLAHFDTLTQIDILKEFDNKKEAMAYETHLINEYSKQVPLINNQNSPWIYTSCIPATNPKNILNRLNKELERIKSIL